jgi:hypothetical protein
MVYHKRKVHDIEKVDKLLACYLPSTALDETDMHPTSPTPNKRQVFYYALSHCAPDPLKFGIMQS